MSKELSLRKVMEDSFNNIFAKAIYILLFQLAYKGLVVFIFKPIMNYMVGFFIRLGGYDILINGDIIDFSLSFLGLIMIFLLVLLSILIVFYEFTVILLILDSRKGERIDLLAITEEALLNIRGIIKKPSLALGIYILVLVPILNIGIQSALIPSLSIPDFITGEILKHRGAGILLAGLIYILIRAYSRRFLVLPIMIFSKMNYRKASRKSKELVKNNSLRIIVLVLVSIGLWLSLAYIPVLIFKNTSFILFKFLKFISNIVLILFTLLVSPMVLSLSLEIYNIHAGEGKRLERMENDDLIELGFLGEGLWKILEAFFSLIERLIQTLEKRSTYLLVLVFILVLGISFYDVETSRSLYGEQFIIGHRGAKFKGGIENTSHSIIFAGLNGADYVEIDVLLSKDGVPLVIHDNNLKRLTGKSKKISELSLEEVKAIDLKPDGKRGSSDKIPSLEELILDIRDDLGLKGDLRLLIEFKTHGREEASIVHETIKVLDELDYLDKVVFQTSELDLIREFNDSYKELPIGYIFIGSIGSLTERKMDKIPADFISAEESLINKRMLLASHKAGKAVLAWTINDDYKARRLFELGVDGIITDYPHHMKEIRDEFEDSFVNQLEE